MNAYIKGNLVRVSAVFTDDTGALIDPSMIKCAVLAPGAVMAQAYTYGIDAEITRVATGTYHLDIDASVDGVWRYRWYSTGNGQAANEDAFEIAISLFEDGA